MTDSHIDVPTRSVFHEDALTWLNEPRDLAGCSFITSLPDLSEFKSMKIGAWKLWFVNAAKLVLSRCQSGGVVIFFQSDIKHEGVWIDKGFLCQKAAEESGHVLLWHKIVCRFEPGKHSFGRPAYSHLLCFSSSEFASGVNVASPLKGKEAIGADVLAKTGGVTWTRGMGVDACIVSCEYVATHTNCHTVIDPFCGHGTVLAVANDVGLNGIGVELVARRAQKARRLEFSGGILRSK